MTEQQIAALLAKYPCEKRPDGALITCPVRLSWLNLDKPVGSMSRADDLRYRATLLFPAAADLTVLRAAASEAAVAMWGAKTGEVVASPTFKKPLQPQDAKAGKYDGYVAGAWRSNVTTKRKPPVVGLDLSALDPANTENVYPGMWARVKITVRAYDQSGGRGVAFDLVSIQKVADDAAFGGGASTDSMDGFTAVAGAVAVAANGAAGSHATAAGKPASDLF